MSGTSTQAAAGASDAQPVAVSQEDFLHHMAAMQQHYRAADPAAGQPVSLYIPPARLTLAVPRPPVGAGTAQAVREVRPGHGLLAPNEATGVSLTFTSVAAVEATAQASRLMAEALRDQQQRTLAFINSRRDAMLQAIAAARGSPGTQAFSQQMDAIRDRAKADNEAHIDALFARLTAIGTAHPAARPVVLGAGSRVGGFVAGIAAAAAGVAGTVGSALAAGGAAVGKAAEAVGNWASDAAQSVGHFFGGLF